MGTMRLGFRRTLAVGAGNIPLITTFRLNWHLPPGSEIFSGRYGSGDGIRAFPSIFLYRDI